jgi:hypothetical protein
MKKTLAFVLVVVLLMSAIACSKPSLEQQRADLIEYLAAFNNIDDEFAGSYAEIQSSGPADALQFNNAVNQMLIVWDGAMQSLTSLKTPDIAEVKTYLATYIQLMQDEKTAFKDIQTAVNAADPAAIKQAVDKLGTIKTRVTAFYRTTEALMLKYNISDSEVGYQYRGNAAT